MKYEIIGTRRNGHQLRLAQGESGTTTSNHAGDFAAVAKQYPNMPTLTCRTETGAILIRRLNG